MREKIARFMYGRYGADEFSKFLLHMTLVSCVISVVLNLFHIRFLSTLCYWIALALIVYSYTRMFSRNISKRYDENQKFLFRKMAFVRRFKSERIVMKQRRYYHFYRCPSCNQRIRIPKGKGKIEIRCPKCSTTFIKKS